VVAVALLFAATVPVASGSVPSPGVALTLSSDGSVTAQLNTIVANGSALRFAMDGYFGPLVNSLPGTNASRAALLSEINATENNPIFAGLFGDRDGRVDGSVDVPRFQTLILSEARLIPLAAITGALNVTMDGNGPTSDKLEAVSFSDAPGPDNSSAPIGVTATLTATFSWSGVGESHTFVVAWNLPAIVGNLSVPVAAVNLSFTTPPAITITSVSGLNESHTSNDLLGWGSASASGQYTPLPGHNVVIHFGPAFPSGDALIVGAVALVAGGLVGLLLLRRRRGRRLSGAPPPHAAEETGTGVGPSSGSG
jgi:hypothetical protein